MKTPLIERDWFVYYVLIPFSLGLSCYFVGVTPSVLEFFFEVTVPVSALFALLGFVLKRSR